RRWLARDPSTTYCLRWAKTITPLRMTKVGAHVGSSPTAAAKARHTSPSQQPHAPVLPSTVFWDAEAPRGQWSSHAVSGNQDRAHSPRRQRHSDEGHSRSPACRRCRRASLSAYSRPGETSRDVRWHLPHYRHHAFQLPQLGPAPRLHSHAIQGTLTE